MTSFDQAVLERLKVMTEDRLNAMEQWFWGVTQFALNDKAQFNQTDWYFLLEKAPLGGVPLGRYLLPRKARTTALQGYEYRLNQPLGQWCISEALKAYTPNATLVFDYKNFPEKISLLEQYQGKSGWLRLNKISVESNAESQESLVFTVCDEQGHLLDKEFAQKLFSLSADLQNAVKNPPLVFVDLVKEQIDREKARIKAENNALLKAESVRINTWAKDQMQAAEDLISEIKEAMRSKEKELVLADDIERQIQLREDVAKLRKQLRKARNELDDVQDEIAEQELQLLKELKGKIHQIMRESLVFEIFWKIQ
ncbi:helicase SNF2 [Rodentibacter pneumotropicus]|nr:helicase SNF2 [Rodentibacter pneumotropicus]